MRSNIILLVLGAVALVTSAPIDLSESTTTTTVTAASVTCDHLFGPTDHGSCFGRHCGPQNFDAGEMPTHCHAATLGATIAESQGMETSGDLPQHVTVDVYVNGHPASTVTESATGMPAGAPTVRVTVSTPEATATVRINQYVDWKGHTTLITTETDIGIPDGPLTTQHAIVSIPTPAATLRVDKYIDGNGHTIATVTESGTGIPAGPLTTQFAVVSIPTATPSGQSQPLEKRRNLCRIVDEMLRCGHALAQYLSEHPGALVRAQSESKFHDLHTLITRAIPATIPTAISDELPAPTDADIEKRQYIALPDHVPQPGRDFLNFQRDLPEAEAQDAEMTPADVPRDEFQVPASGRLEVILP